MTVKIQMQVIWLQSLHLNHITTPSLYVNLANTPSSIIFKCSKLSTWYPQTLTGFYSRFCFSWHLNLVQVAFLPLSLSPLYFSLFLSCFFVVTWFSEAQLSSMGLYTHTYTHSLVQNETQQYWKAIKHWCGVYMYMWINH